MQHANTTGILRRSAYRVARRPGAAALLVATLAAASGCATNASDQTWYNPLGLGAAPTSPPPAEGVVLPVRAADPVAAFAGRARIGQQESVPLPDSGSLVTARLARTYMAASGRECREVQFSAGAGAIYCNDPAAGWVAARPLLRGGAVARP